ncbi:hydroxyphenylacetyl-CoA thioesterase PaaI [Limimaricola litoreus]|uniref:Hydroxyphenylacetyl-CoA thioesterase PaaI n=1 Tax=Limimaricola litoreus TaxID=2955316 RepID=A0A9X2FNM4_9RHOB|nr:hydroxyphenylacetyl-CoA thioesterase PaaI [Limimaricola litoreus]MCP1168682.1 hydroxyphenylacetyl-CoA thioesterase PaaI [Limimaricola litoreus]
MSGAVETRLDPQAQAEKRTQEMWEEDTASRAMGMELVEVGPGHAQMRMKVREDMVNGHGTLHGGLTFAFADSVFAFAANSYDYQAVGVQCDIVYHAPGRLGDVLIGVGREVTRAGRSGLYDVAVQREDGTLIASFRGNSRIVTPRAK